MFDLVRTTFREFLDDNGPRLAAALSFYTVFSLPPLLILVTMIASTIWSPQEVEGMLVQELGGAIGPDGARQIRLMLEHAERPGSGGPFVTALSVAALFFGATGAFGQLQAALNDAWDVEKDPEKSGLLSIAGKRAVSFGMIIVIVFLLLVSLVLSAALGAAGSVIASSIPGGLAEPALWTLDLGLSLLVITLLFAAMYKVLPDARIAWSDVWRGALVTAALFVAGKFLLGVYISRTDPGSAYGAAGSLAVILVWVYYSAMIVFLGAEFTEVYANRRGGGIRSDADAAREGEQIHRERESRAIR